MVNEYEIHTIIREHYKRGKASGFEQGIKLGLFIGLVILAIVLVVLFTPLNILLGQ